MNDVARILIAAMLFGIAYLIVQQHKPQPALPLVQADWTQCVKVKNAPLPKRARSINAPALNRGHEEIT